MPEYIEREALIADIEKRHCGPCKAEGNDYKGVACRACWVGDMILVIDAAPTIDAVQEQEERDNGCSTCDGAIYMYGDFTVVRPNEGEPWDDGPYTKWFTDGAPFFSHCPCCGRKLRRVDDD